MRQWIALCSIACAGVALGACGDDDDRGPEPDGGREDGGSGRDGGMSGSGGRGGSGGSSGSGGSGGSTATVMCGGETCMAPAGGAMLGTACCTPDDECGIMSMLVPGMCLPRNAPGGVDRSCPTYDVMGFLTLNGCCTPDGECGALSGESGCVANSLLMVAPQSCNFDPDNMCTSLTEVNCDGAEDCPGQQVCCGNFQLGAEYLEFVCADDCQAEQAEQGGTWSVACHPGDTCETPADAGMVMGEYACRANTMYLPDFLYRCRDTGTEAVEPGSTAANEVNCGDSVCGAGEKCCISQPDSMTFCVPSSQPCTCTPGGTVPPPDDAGTEDGGR